MKLHFKLIICYVAAIVAVFFCVNWFGNRIIEENVKHSPGLCGLLL